MNRRDLIIIGGGAGGLVVASVASQLGLAVTLIERETKLGGDCLHYGCVPSKTLIHVAKSHLGRRLHLSDAAIVAIPISQQPWFECEQIVTDSGRSGIIPVNCRRRIPGIQT